MLAVENLHAYYGPSHVLQGVSLDVREGEVVSLLGRNGAGKTTTLLAIMGYLKPNPGRIAYRGRDIGNLPPYVISRLGLGFVPQERGIFASLTVRENLTVAARRGDRRLWTLDKVLELFPHLKERVEFRGSKLSGGEQQILSIARALLLNPSLLVLDEPSEGLAPLIVQEVIRTLQDVRKRGLSILIVEQNVRVALAVADRHFVLSKGQVCFAGTTEELKRNEAMVRQHLGL
jgi:branched-chain amino acid transport system ATP-binding protein